MFALLVTIITLEPIRITNKFFNQLFSSFKQKFDHNVIKTPNSIKLAKPCCNISIISYTPSHNSFKDIII